MTDQERQAGDQVEEETEQRQRHERPDGIHRNAAEKAHQADVQKSDDADHQRQADEVDRLCGRPDPGLEDDRLRETGGLQPGNEGVHGAYMYAISRPAVIAPAHSSSETHASATGWVPAA